MSEDRDQFQFEPANDEAGSEMSYEFQLTDAEVIATVAHNGGAIVERGLDLKLSEGREWRCPTDDGLMKHEYCFLFAVAGAPAPEAAEAVEARIVIVGKDHAGSRLEIRGDGWIGYDDQSNLEGRFDAPPTIYSDDPEADCPEPYHATSYTGARSKPSTAYLAAARGRAVPETESD